MQLIWGTEGLKVAAKQPKRSRSWLNDGSFIRLRPEHRNPVSRLTPSARLLDRSDAEHDDASSYCTRLRPTG